jgi:cytochrome c oxidase subunit 2
VNRFWALVFLTVPIFGVLTFVVAPYFNHWFPKDVSEHGRIIDQLFMFILWLTGIIFIATEVALFYFAWKYDGRSNPEPVKFSHGSHTLEVVWTILPAVTLLFIAIYQMNAWADATDRCPCHGRSNRPAILFGRPLSRSRRGAAHTGRFGARGW